MVRKEGLWDALVPLVIFAALLWVFAAPAGFADSDEFSNSGHKEAKILQQSKNQDPGLIELTVESVVYHSDTGNIAITWKVAANCDFVSVYVVDFNAEQEQAKQTLSSSSSTSDEESTNWCGSHFTNTVPSPGEVSFRRGPATVQVSASACSRSCTSESMTLEVVLR